MNHQAGLEYERSFWDQGKHVVGIDEAGRGPIAGPLVVAGAVFDIGYTNSEIYDSKALSEKKREKLFSLILREARCYKIKIVTPEEIDTLNIYRATQKAMEEIACEINAEAVLTDAMPLLHAPSRRVDHQRRSEEPVDRGRQYSGEGRAGSYHAGLRSLISGLRLCQA